METQLNRLDDHDLRLLDSAHHAYSALTGEIGKVIIGQDETVRLIIASILARGHTLIIGVPGLAKTLLVRTIAQVLNWSFRRIQFTPDMMPADIIGIELLQEDPVTGGRRMQFVAGPIFAQIILADEINRTPPKTQAALLEAMQEHTVTSMGKSHRLDEPFIVFATQNPIEQEGTYPLPEAQLDRFMFSLWMTYPSAVEEEKIAISTTQMAFPEVQQVVGLDQILALQQLVRRMPVSQHIVSYAVALARASRPQEPEASGYVRQYVTWGAGPRASQYLLLGARALAVLDGQPTVSAAHVREVAPLVLRHRILPNYHATGEGITAVDIVAQIISETAEPVYGR
jgi:MoxR-like ATPase